MVELRYAAAFVCLSLIVCLVPKPGHAKWPRDLGVNVPVSIAPGDQGGWTGEGIELVSDEQGGAFIFWLDVPSGDIRAQLIDSGGEVMWPVNGIAVSNSHVAGTSYYDGYFRVVSDGRGGAICTWSDNRNGDSDIYAQKVSATGSLGWGNNGVAVARVQGTQSWPELVSDGTGGAFITWRDQRTAPSDSYVQWIDSNGTPRWQANGVNISGARNHQYYPKIISDGKGGVIVTWMDDRSHGVYYHWAIYAQRFDATGKPLWAKDGVLVYGKAGNSYINPEIVSDGHGGAIILYRRNEGFEEPSPREEYVQRLDATGNKLWAPGGIRILPAGDEIWGMPQWTRTLVPDLDGGCYFVWYWSNLKAQHIDFSGSLLWGAGGLVIDSVFGNLAEDIIAVPDSLGGFIATWTHYHDVPGTVNSAVDIFAQRVNTSGHKMWGSAVVPVSTAKEGQLSPKVAADGSGGAIFTWADFRNNKHWIEHDVYAQKLFRTGRPWESGTLAPVYNMLLKKK